MIPRLGLQYTGNERITCHLFEQQHQAVSNQNVYHYVAWLVQTFLTYSICGYVTLMHLLGISLHHWMIHSVSHIMWFGIGSLGTSVTLTSNITSEGGSLVCPGIIQLTCMAQLINVTSFRWFLNRGHQQELLVSYSAISHSTDAFPLTVKEMPKVVILSASLSVTDRETNFLSTLTTNISWFNHMNIRSIRCGSYEQSASLETNYFIKGIFVAHP